MEKTTKIMNTSGLHARPASIFVKMATGFTSAINIEFNGKNVNAKSIMNLLSLGLKKDDEIKIIANGEDEVEAVEALVGLIHSKFSE
ncbi:HPr family phosphocarrier protein [Marinisporobacter balticus]|uniref:Phosphocarrier protein HPr n=1 Tax=Marinisporobacter balticus TaxID=2018667 RepID=A0A4R2L301_9FIRM|nr:HPr family phosphocarrier protein [Marinisporobacter balticus]TCO76938.1 phosphocarrier protein [Marinisporobacter balticus]